MVSHTNKQRQWTNAPPSGVISTAKKSRLSNACSITQWRRSRALLEATGRWHWVTTCSVLPCWPPGQQSTTQQWKNTPTLLAVSMAIAMWRYNTTRITQCRWSRASLEATGCTIGRALAPIASIGHANSVCVCFLPTNCRKMPQSKRIAPNNNRGMPYQTD